MTAGTKTGPPPGLFAGGGRMGERMAAYDWSSTPLGPPEAWPQGLKAVVRILLTSRYAMWMGWGPDLTFFCNDAYAPTLGVKQDWALGASARTVWEEIWPDIGPRIDTVLSTGTATYDEGLLLFLERSGFPEETYHTFSYSPLFDDDGAIAGMFCVVVEETDRLIGERRMSTLRELAARTADARTVADACVKAAEGLLADCKDVPHAAIYLMEPDRRSLRLAAAAGLDLPHPSAPPVAALDHPGFAEFVQVLDSGEIVECLIAPAIRDALVLHEAGWDVASERAAVVPLGASAEGGPVGMLTVALNPYRPFDESYRSFLDLVGGQIAAAIANAQGYEEERRRAEALAEIDRAKTAFFSNVSHEFRTPLTLLLGPLEEALAASNGDHPQARALLETAHRNGLRLLKLVNTLLDFSRIEAGRNQARFRPTDMSAVTAELASSFRSAMERAGLSLTVDAPPLPRPVPVDRDMWEKVVLNLLSNAFKFTFDGGVTVRVRESADGKGAEVSVIDTGEGIPERELPRLFERFHRVEGAKGRSYEGSGIGLALVRELVNLHGGAIAVESTPGQGSVFTVRLPYEAAGPDIDMAGEDDQEVAVSHRARGFVEEAVRWLPDGLVGDLDGPSAQVQPDPSAEGAGRRVLLADDNADMRDYVRRLLVAQGYEVEAVADGEAALQAARLRAPDLLLADVMMPRLDGFGLLKAVRGDPGLRDLPVVLLSARAGEEARVEGLGAGADDYLIKPFAARELLARVAAMLDLSRLRRSAMESIRDSEERLRQAVRATGLGIWDVQVRTGQRSWSEEFFAIMGVAADARPDQAYFSSLIHPDDRPAVERLYAESYADPDKAHYVAEFRILRANDGAERWVRTEGLVSFDEAGQAVRGSGTLLDITDRRQVETGLEARVAERTAELAAANRQLLTQITERERVEEALRRSQRLEAVGQLTSGVAHDFNNLLTVILGNIGFLQRDADEAASRRLEMMRVAATRGASLTGQLLAFSRRQRLDAKRIDLNEAVEAMRELLQSTLGGGIRISTQLQPDLWPALVDPTQFELVVLNLAINARDAMGVGGSLVVATANVKLGEPVQPEDPPAGDYVMAAITDTGSGMTADVLAKAFEPFFTTKEPGKGSGLGLAQVFGFARQSGGGVRITTALGEGTTVAVYLPRARRVDSEAIVAPVAAQQRPEAGLTLLVVDDDGAVREVTSALLRERGYLVEEAASGAGALEFLANGARIDAMVADYAMPGMNGVELARTVRVSRPGLPVVFLTGYADIDVLTQAGERFVVQKPFETDDLDRRLQAAMAERRAAEESHLPLSVRP